MNVLIRNGASVNMAEKVRKMLLAVVDVSHVLLCWDCKTRATQHLFVHVHCGLCLSRSWEIWIWNTVQQTVITYRQLGGGRGIIQIGIREQAFCK